MAAPDMDVIREIPGYKVILKAIIKSQIQQLVEQLASNTDEESVILTASVTDGTLSHMGSDSAKGFLEDHEDIKSQFLGFCLKSHHERQEAEKEAIRQKELAAKAAALRPSPMDMMGPGPRRMRMPYHMGPRGQHYSPTGYVSRPPGVRHEPYPVQRPMRRPSAASSEMPSHLSQNPSLDNSANFPIVKSEPMEDSTTGANISDNVNKDDDNTNSSNPNETEDKSGDDSSSQVDPSAVKIESISESEFELEITGVEPGVTTPSMAPDNSNWGQNVSSTMGFDPSMGAMGSAADMSMASSQGYNLDMFSSMYSEGSSTGSGAGAGTDVNHACEVCGKGFKSSGNLKQHMIIHSGEKPFACKLCGKCFNLKGNLKKHMAVHYINPN